MISTWRDEEREQTLKQTTFSKSLALSFGCLVTRYYALEYCCCATRSSHCQDPYVAVFFCFQGGPGITDCHGWHLLLAPARRCHNPVLVGHGCAVPKDKKRMKPQSCTLMIC